MTVVKKDGSREPYDRRKLIAGIQKASYKRPVTDDDIRRIVEGIEEAIFQEFDRDVPSRFVGDQVAARLREVDKIAYVRFASVYRDFADVGELITEAKEVEDAPAVGPEQKPLFGQQE